MNRILGTARSVARKLGVDLIRYTPGKSASARLRRLLASQRIVTTLDVGANVGQFANRLRRDYGFEGRIISFEPSEEAFAILERAAGNDQAWQAFRLGLGDREEARLLNVSENSQSSSVLEVLPLHLSVAPESRTVSQETIQLRRLDVLWDELGIADAPVFLKLDVQGFERQVLDGAADVLDRLSVVQLELSVTPLYEGEMVLGEALARMQSHGLALCSCEPSFTDEARGKALQFDCVFAR